MRHYLKPNPYDDAAEPLIVINPSDDSGGQRLRHQFIAYSGREETRFAGPGGIIKKNDDLIDPALYLCAKRLHHSPDYACGPTTMVSHPDAPPTPEQTIPSVIISPYEQRMLASRARRRPSNGFTESDF